MEISFKVLATAKKKIKNKSLNIKNKIIRNAMCCYWNDKIILITAHLSILYDFIDKLLCFLYPIIINLWKACVSICATWYNNNDVFIWKRKEKIKLWKAYVSIATWTNNKLINKILSKIFYFI